jgi:cold shock CspA family protein
MAKIMVELVKYDTAKTKKRKRANLLVDSKNEEAVIAKLEKIHKGDKIQVIHEVIWGEQVAIKEKPEVEAKPLYTGEIKFYDEVKEFGFIKPDGDMDDLFFHSSALGGVVVYEHDIVDFEISEGPKGTIAIRIQIID